MRILSGIQPSNKIHIGNYFGAIKQFIDLQDQGEALYFIADLHALTTVRDGARLDQLSLDVALDFLACGLDPSRCALFRQSDIPEIPELFWYLTVLTPMGLLEKAVSYKDKVARGFSAEAGLFTYPALMAADILLYGSDVVPVGKDQVQHLEITRDLAIKFNLAFVPRYDPSQPDGDRKGRGRGILKLPEARVLESTAVVPGTDGQKMSKSYGNVIEMFAEDSVVKKQIMTMKTDSAAVEDAKDPAATPILPLLRLFASPDEIAEHERTFREGGLGYGHYKARILELFHAHFGEARARRRELEKNRDHVEQVLRDGAARARSLAAPIMEDVRRAVGTRGLRPPGKG
jgi:tryptophanyl-tRNA synthetase